MSIKTYRRQLEHKVEAASARSAARGLGRRREQETLALLGPREEDLLATLARSEAPATERLGALAILKVLAFSSPDAHKYRPRFIESLRAAVDDPGVRLAALNTLTRLGDAPTRERLLAGLRDPKRAVVARHEAFQLLANDQHADGIVLARSAVDEPTDVRSKEAALSLLARDASSVDRLSKVVRDKAAPTRQRRAAARSLFALDAAALRRVRPGVADNAQVKAFVDGLLGPAMKRTAKVLVPRRKRSVLETVPRKTSKASRPTFTQARPAPAAARYVPAKKVAAAAKNPVKLVAKKKSP